MTHPDGRRSVWRVLAAATALTAPVGTLYAFSVFLRPLEALLGLQRADLALVFAVAAAFFGVGMMLAPALYRIGSTPWLVLGCAASNALGIALAATAGGLVQLAVGYGVFFGLGGGAAYILVQQMVNLAVTSRQGLVNGYIVSLLPAGAMIAAPAFGWAIRAFGVRAALGGFAATLAVTGLLSAWLAARAGISLAGASGGAALGDHERRRPVFWRLSLVFFLAASAGLMVLSQAAGIITAYGGAASLAVYGTTLITAVIAARAPRRRLDGGLARHPDVAAGANAIALAGSVVLTLWPGPRVAVARPGPGGARLRPGLGRDRRRGRGVLAARARTVGWRAGSTSRGARPPSCCRSSPGGSST